MTTLVPHAEIGEQSIHSDWVATWVDTFPESGLPEKLLSNERFCERAGELIVQQEFGKCLADTRADEDCIKSLVFVRSCQADVLFRLLGILWLAPALALKLPSANCRKELCLTDREELSLIVQYSRHASLKVVGDIVDSASFGHEGLLCLHAWLRQLGQPSADRLSLIFPKPIGQSHSNSLRAELVSRAVSDNVASAMLAK